jgi:regulator of nucleoside diphosphate kinase
MTNDPICITDADKDRLLEVIVEAENDKYHGSIYTRQLREEVQRAQVMDKESIPADVITMHSTATLLDQTTGERMKLTLVYPEEADMDAGKISVLAPIGVAMLGYRMGDVFEWETPGGKRTIMVEKVLYQPEAAGDTE